MNKEIIKQLKRIANALEKMAEEKKPNYNLAELGTLPDDSTGTYEPPYDVKITNK